MLNILKITFIYFCCGIVFPLLAKADSLKIGIPATPASLPIILLAQKTNDINFTVYTNHEKANALFIRKDLDILVTGVSVGINLFKQNIPVKMINSFVKKMSWIVSTDKNFPNLSKLKNEKIYLPFEGSPLEEITKYLIEKNGLKWKVDVIPIYSPFPATLELLKQGKAKYAVFPEPFVSMLKTMHNQITTVDLVQELNKVNTQQENFPQIGSFTLKSFLEKNKARVDNFNKLLQVEIKDINNNFSSKIDYANKYIQYSLPIMKMACNNMIFDYYKSKDLQQMVTTYYNTIGLKQNEDFANIFYLD